MAAKSGKKNAAKKSKAKKAPAKTKAKKAAKKPAKAKAKPKAAAKATKKAAAKPQKKLKASAKAKVAAKPKAKVKAPAKVAKAKKETSSKTAVAIAEAQAVVPADILAEEEIVLTDAEGRRYCRAADCDQLSLVDGYCRYHYLLFWKKIQNRKKILAGGKLERYIDELTSRYADKFIEMLRKDLRSEKDFMLAIQELELDDDSSGNEEQEEEETKTYLEEIRGISSDDSSSGDDDY